MAVKIQLQKSHPDCSEEYTDPGLGHKHDAALQASEMSEAFERICLKNGHKGALGGWLTECRPYG